MTVKQFFKSTSFKCIITLLCVLLISGIFLTVMNGLLEVTEGERLQRAVNEIYSDGSATPVIYGKDDKEITAAEKEPEGLIDKNNPVKYESAEIIQMYKIVYGSETDYLVQSTGMGGYSGGTVTCWVAVTVNLTSKNIVKVRKVSVKSYVGQTFMQNLTESFFTSFTKEYKDYYSTDEGFVTAGASMSSNAICNSVNGATTHIKNAVFGVTSSNPYDEFKYSDRTINVTNPNSYFEAGENGSVVFHIVTKASNGEAGPFTVTITVNAEKAVEKYEVVKSGSTSEYYDTQMYPVTNYIGWKEADFLAEMNDKMSSFKGNVITTGASYSTYLCVYAGAFATANYQNALDKLNEGGETNE